MNVSRERLSGTSALPLCSPLPNMPRSWLVLKFKIRSGAALPQMSRNASLSLSLVLIWSKAEKEKYGKEYPTYSTSILKLMFYLKITMLMLSLLLFVIVVCLVFLHNTLPHHHWTLPPAVKLWFKLLVIITVFNDTMSVPHARWQANTVAVCLKYFCVCLSLCFLYTFFFKGFNLFFEGLLVCSLFFFYQLTVSDW